MDLDVRADATGPFAITTVDGPGAGSPGLLPASPEAHSCPETLPQRPRHTPPRCALGVSRHAGRSMAQPPSGWPVLSPSAWQSRQSSAVGIAMRRSRPIGTEHRVHVPNDPSDGRTRVDSVRARSSRARLMSVRTWSRELRLVAASAASKSQSARSNVSDSSQAAISDRRSSACHFKSAVTDSSSPDPGRSALGFPSVITRSLDALDDFCLSGARLLREADRCLPSRLRRRRAGNRRGCPLPQNTDRRFWRFWRKPFSNSSRFMRGGLGWYTSLFLNPSAPTGTYSWQASFAPRNWFGLSQV